MSDNNDPGCCSCAPGCCASIPGNIGQEIKMNKKQITIDFLFLDLSVCTR